MPTLIITTNVSATHTTIGDMGVVVPASGGSITLNDREDLKVAAGSLDLITYTTDDAFGAGSSTLILNDGTSNIAQTVVEEFLASLLMATTGPFSIPVRDASGNDVTLIDGFAPTNYTPTGTTAKGHWEGIDAALAFGGALPPATQIGQVLHSINGVSFTVQLPLAANCGGWMTNDLGYLLVVG